jgi:hypothetical protein
MIVAGFPDGNSTGVREGVTLRQVGDMTVTTPGAIISGLEIHGTLRIEADNVTVRDCKIVNEGGWHGILIPDGNTGAVVEFCDIIGPVNGISGTGTFRSNDFSSNDNGINVYGPSLIVDNYIHDMSGGADAHYDGIEINGGGGTSIRHNTIINEHAQTSAVMINNDFGAVPGIIIDNNYLAGGGYTIYSDGRFSSTDLITGVQITNNYLGQGYWGYYAFWNNAPLVSGNHELGRTWPTPVSDGSTQPAPTISSFSSDSGTVGDHITNDNTLSLNGTASANSTVNIFDGTKQLGTVTANASGAWSYTTGTLLDAIHSFTATATDAAGNVSAASTALVVTVIPLTIDTVPPAPPVRGTGDYNGDGNSDILWRHDSGQVYFWEMNGLQIQTEGGVAHAPVPNDWHIQTSGDFDADGNSDVLWRHDSGQVYFWEMNGLQIKAEGGVVHAAVPNDWHIEGTGDFDADGKSDILWRHDNGQVYFWEMDGLQIKAEGSAVHAPVPNDWHIQGTGDFNADGNSDLVWRHDNGQVYFWEMDGLQIKTEGSVVHAPVPNDWHIQGTGDFNGDGKSDLLWRHDSGQVYIWEMDGLNVKAEGTVVHAAVPNDWRIQGTGDFNGDGKSDIAWRHDSGQVYFWEMNGLGIKAEGSVAHAAVPNDWHILA